MPDSLVVVGQNADWVIDLVKLAVGPVIALIGVLITVYMMNRQNRQQLDASNAHAEQLLQQKIEELKIEIESKQLAGC
jgi:hypothetical protein